MPYQISCYQKNTLLTYNQAPIQIPDIFLPAGSIWIQHSDF
ncbi:hypothetical protein QNI19_37155 [Cytophagaceae bacterium DM2B3-1]|uniref:Uncharacterized protein n=1 Tax=Xanthocytophaga flava TaxID=3048013 RepID=A0ABT7CY10_9BACT|nr:hypothetical protein [Xanthocytophaga flavus]MDJ1467133.1 hypothetical protein [Xanthocytophaga flavus]MDJ1498623.1 hypothetical protein [Xanthocytophaga flavus]